jgi:hypothetical protein
VVCSSPAPNFRHTASWVKHFRPRAQPLTLEQVDDRDTVRMVNNHRQDLAHGTIWEIARVLQPLQRGSADATPRTLSEEKLKELHGTNCESAAKVLGVVKGASSSSKPKTAPQTQEQGAPVSVLCFVLISVISS